MNQFQKGWLYGGATAMAGLALWALLAFRTGVTGEAYDWSYHLFKTDVWVASDILLTVFLVGMTTLAFSLDWRNRDT